ncbi:MAG TPA: lysylphosphatidylglycerol synthase transmembrane domain-containing protein, partial [bacterium]
LPAHLGEFLRAYVVGRKRKISVSSALATIVVERIIDIFFLLAVLLVTILIYPFPKTKEISPTGIFKFLGIDKLSIHDLITISGYILFIFSIGLLVFLIVLKKYTKPTMEFIQIFFRPFPGGLNEKITNLSRSFIDGLKKMEHKRDYFFILILSFLIWFCYWGVLYLNFYTFPNFVSDYDLNMTSGLVILVITTISVVVPSSPGYIGTYHFLCQISLTLFGVSRTEGLTYAILVHAINFFPIFIVGFILAWKEGIKLSKVQKEL